MGPRRQELAAWATPSLAATATLVANALAGTAAIAAAVLATFTGRAVAHGGSLGGAAGRDLGVPTWLFLVTGGGVVGVSFLLASFATDRDLLAAIHGWRRAIGLPAERVLAGAARAGGVLGLVAVVVAGWVGPADALSNLAVLLVWVGWWAGLAMSTYLLGNAWPLLNPWRTLVGLLPTLDREYPARLGAWPSVVGLLALVWLEVVSPVAGQPRTLVAVVVAYTAVTLAGGAVFGETWFERVDPVARVFRLYGRVAPLEADDGVRLRLPGTGLVDEAFDEPGADAFVVALLWVTTFDGLVATPPWVDLATAAVGFGLPAPLLYPLAEVAGFAAFLGAFRLAIRRGRRDAETYRSRAHLAGRFAPSLLAIAAGYHLAHYLGYFLTLSPALLGALASPLSPGAPEALVLPGWFGGLSLAFVLVGHLLAVWVAHAVAYDLFPSRHQAIRSQYALTLVMVFYTMTSLWIVSRPFAEVPFV